MGVEYTGSALLMTKKPENAPDARDGVYYTGTPDSEEDPVKIVGQSHHYETMALALYAKEQINFRRLDTYTRTAV